MLPLIQWSLNWPLMGVRTVLYMQSSSIVQSMAELKEILWVQFILAC